MREGIYLDAEPVHEDDLFKGFVVGFWGGKYEMLVFTACSLPWIRSRALAWNANTPVDMIYVVGDQQRTES